MTSKPHIGIIGAGISGLRCAAKLKQYGFDVTLLEGRDRLGGRICQSDKLGYPIDLGPQWIHTSGDNPLLDIAKKTETPLHSWNEYINLYDPAGNLLSNDKAVEIDEPRWRLVEEAMAFSAAHENDIAKSDSLIDFVAKRVRQVLPDEADQALLLGMVEMWGNYIGDPISRQSLKFVWMEECCGGEELIVTSTFQNILDFIAEEALRGVKVLFDHQVVSVTSSPPASSTSKTVSLLTSRPSVHSFDGVVVTTPLGWLKRNQTAFGPPLETRIVEAINAISVGHLEKVYITFPTAFWQDEPSLPFQSDAEPPIMQSTEREFAGYTNWISPEYACSTNPNKWPQEAYNLAAFAEPHRHPTLLFYQYGEQSAFLTNKVETMSPKEHHDFLQEFFRPYYCRLKNYDDADPACQPTAILSTAWYKDELAGYGSYCNFQVGMNDARGDVEALRRGCQDQRIWFAGEHCAPFDEMGTATGAYLSGEAAAECVALALGKLQPLPKARDGE